MRLLAKAELKERPTRKQHERGYKGPEPLGQKTPANSLAGIPLENDEPHTEHPIVGGKGPGILLTNFWK